MPDFVARPPEVTTGMLQAGPGMGPWLEAAAAYLAQSGLFSAQATQMLAALAEAAAHWDGLASLRAIEAASHMPTWLLEAGLQAGVRATRANAQATTYNTAYVTTPQLAEIAQNHITHGVLEGTNFMGINTVPIGMNEADYMRMWTLAATVMTAYMMETLGNIAALDPVVPPTPITIPGAGEAVLVSSGFTALAGTPQAVGRNAVWTTHSATSIINTAKFGISGTVAQGSNIEQQGEMAGMTGAEVGQQAGSETSQQSMTTQQPAMQAMQIIPQIASEAGQAPMQAVQAPMQGMSSFTSPLGQMTSLFSGGAWGKDATGAGITQVGLFDVNPASNHPLAGGTGAALGGGMFSGGGIPGGAGASLRTPLLASVTSAASPPTSPGEVAVQPAAAPDAAAVRGGAAPMGMAPAGMGHKQAAATGTVEQLVAPGPLEFEDHSEIDIDDWG